MSGQNRLELKNHNKNDSWLTYSGSNIIVKTGWIVQKD